jgi:hypothetical protein
MKIFLISQDTNNNYDTFDSAVVAAENEEIARAIDPATGELNNFKKDDFFKYIPWCRSIDDVKAEYLGEAVEGTKQGVILASFNAG